MTPRTAARRRQHADRLLSPDSAPALTACDYACAPFDRAMLDADRIWGVNRLPELVAPETAARWGSALAKLNAAIEAADQDETVARVGVCLRGLNAMDVEARQRGHQPLTPVYWQTEIDGRRVALVRDASEWPVVGRELPGVTIFTLAEAARALMTRAEDWPRTDDSHPKPVRTAIAEDLSDDIVF
jgi:hypothetical protein